MSKYTGNIAGVILSGGEGRRLGGVDKGLTLFNERPLIEHVLDRIKPQTSQIIICANRNLEDYRKLGHSVIQDADSLSFQGPMAGLAAAISHLEPIKKIDAVLVCSCDSPYVPLDHSNRLSSSIDESNPSALVHDGVRKQNLHCLIGRHAWSSLAKFYAEGGRAMHRWHKKNGSVEVDFSDQAANFKNFNTSESLAVKPKGDL